jgi:hypothetical protein
MVTKQQMPAFVRWQKVTLLQLGSGAVSERKEITSGAEARLQFNDLWHD